MSISSKATQLNSCRIKHYVEKRKRITISYPDELNYINKNIIPKVSICKDPITIGGDPELELLSTNKKYDPIQQLDFKTDQDTFNISFGNIGCDGEQLQIELRPLPDTSINQVIKNMSKLIKIYGKPLSIRGDQYSLGAHIHFGIPEKAHKYTKNIIEMLDDFLGKRFINLSGKARKEFAILGSYQIKSYGFEYRSLPSAILLTPNTTRIVFKIAKNLVENLLTNGYIEYQENPTREDYMRLGGLSYNEYKYIHTFIYYYSYYKNQLITINDAWKLL